jgi:hypothetical protein
MAATSEHGSRVQDAWPQPQSPPILMTFMMFLQWFIELGLNVYLQKVQE